MELKAYLQIIKKHRNVFIAVWSVILFLSLFTVLVQPVSYEGETTILIVRNNNDHAVAVSKEYDYYYQLEADNKLAGMLVGFLKDKSLLNKSFNENRPDRENEKKAITISNEEKKWIIANLRGEVLKGGYVKVKINSHKKVIVEQVSRQLIQELRKKISKIGTDKNRLLKLETEPVMIAKKSKMYLPVGIGAFFGGLLIAFFTVLSIHYWKEE
jgi:hypothetical protein